MNARGPGNQATVSGALSGARRLFRIILSFRRISSCGFQPCLRHVSATEVLLAGTDWNCLSRIERDGFIDYFHISTQQAARALSRKARARRDSLAAREQFGKAAIRTQIPIGWSVGLFTAPDEHLTPGKICQSGSVLVTNVQPESRVSRERPRDTFHDVRRRSARFRSDARAAADA